MTTASADTGADVYAAIPVQKQRNDSGEILPANAIFVGRLVNGQIVRSTTQFGRSCYMTPEAKVRRLGFLGSSSR